MNTYNNISSISKTLKFGVHHLEINPGQPSPKIQLVRQQLYNVFRIFLTNSAHDAASAAEKEMKNLAKITENEKKEAILLAAYSAIIWDDLVNSVITDLLAIVEAAQVEGLQQLNMPVVEDQLASDYAASRAAEMIGKKYVDGELVDFPSAQWVIANTTKDDLSDLIDNAVNDVVTPEQLAERIRIAKIFSAERAELIAKTETSMGQIYGNLAPWKSSGKVKKVNIVLSLKHKVIDECDDIANGSPYLINKVPYLPIHPQCQCSIVAAEIENEKD